jgi:hypothetical protein
MLWNLMTRQVCIDTNKKGQVLIIAVGECCHTPQFLPSLISGKRDWHVKQQLQWCLCCLQMSEAEAAGWLGAASRAVAAHAALSALAFHNISTARRRAKQTALSSQSLDLTEDRQV